MIKRNEENFNELEFLYGQIGSAIKGGLSLPKLPMYISNNLSERFVIRDYQEKAFQYTIHYIERLAKNKQIHLLYHMATGLGKT